MEDFPTKSILIQIVRNRIITLPLILMPIINLKHLFSYWLRIADLPANNKFLAGDSRY